MFIGYLLSKHYNKINDNTIHQGDLLGIYQNENFTNYIENIKVYNSYDNSNKYKFYVKTQTNESCCGILYTGIGGYFRVNAIYIR